MISLRPLSSFTFAFAFALSLVPSLALGDEPSLADWAQQRVDVGLLKPLAQLESRSFSRMRPPPRERRIRVLQATTTLDPNGHPFVPFAVDVRFGADDWHENDIVGCAYTGSGKLYVKRGDTYRPASFLLGKNVEAAASVCVSGTGPS